MSGRPIPSLPAVGRLDPGAGRPKSYTRLAVGDGMVLLGVVTLLCAAAGAADDGGDAAVLAGAGAVVTAVGYTGRASLDRLHRPAPARILTGLALTWTVLVVLGTGIYLATGTIERVDDAFVESAAGFSTTALTTLDPEGLSLPMQLWRAATQWVGGLVGLITGIVALPLALGGRSLATATLERADEAMVPTPITGRRRAALIYLVLTIGCGVAYALTGMGTRHSVVHALTTISTGGFSDQADSFAGFGTGPRVVATAGMVLGGCGIVVLWWLARGRTTTAWRSTELRVYLAVLVLGTLLVALIADELSIGDAAFTVASAVSTTGFAVGDWTVLGDGLLMIMLLLIATGSMSGSAGGGLRVLRAWTLVGFATRELRRQLDPDSVAVVKQAGQAIEERTLERTTGYQIAHLGLCAVAALVLAGTGVDVLGAIYTGISVISTHGPGVGTTAFGDLHQIPATARLALVPFMLAGRMTILPLLLALSFLFRLSAVGQRWLRRSSRRDRR